MSKKSNKNKKEKKPKHGGGNHKLSKNELLDKLGALEFRHGRLVIRHNLTAGKLDSCHAANSRLASALQVSGTREVSALVEKVELSKRYAAAINDADALACELAIAHDLLDAERLINQQQRRIIEIETNRVNR